MACYLLVEGFLIGVVFLSIWVVIFPKSKWLMDFWLNFII